MINHTFETKLGLGTWALFQTNGVWPELSLKRTTQRKVLCFARSNNAVSFVDSATAYGNGESDKLIAKIFGESGIWRGKKVLCSKIGRSLSNVGKLLQSIEEFSYDISKLIDYGTFRSIAIHDSDLFDPDLMGDVCRMIIEKKCSGLLETWGLGLSTPNLSPLLDFKPDFIQCNFNLLDDRLMKSGLYSWARSAKTEVWARTVFLGGVLMQRQNNRNKVTTEKSIKKQAVIDQLISTLEESLCFPIHEIALRYVCSFQGVNPLVGVTSIAMLKENIRIFRKRGFLPPELDLIRNVSADLISQFDGLSTHD